MSTSTGNVYIDALLLDYGAARWNSVIGTSVSLTYSFMTNLPSYYNLNESPGSSFSPVNSLQQDGIRHALSLWSEVANISFTEVSGAGDGGQINIGAAALPSWQTAYTYYPLFANNGPLLSGDIWINYNYSSMYNFASGGEGLWVLAHEVGHALGLSHTANYDNNPFEGPNFPLEDTTKYSIMSYYNNYVLSSGYVIYPSSPMLFDIAAIQYLYGANYNTRAGDDTYSFIPGEHVVKTIWDGGGLDTIDLSNQTTPQSLNMYAGYYSTIGAGLTDNLAIAYGVTIEQALGGSSTDTIIGNDIANYISGKEGDDTIYGNYGDDLLYGDGGNDVLSGGFGHDTLLGADGADLIIAGSNEDYATGGAGSDTIYGDEGYDNLGGGSDNDFMDGGYHDDAVYGDAGNDTLSGNLGNDYLVGGEGYDVLNGDDGNDNIDGGVGNDALYGGNGNDVLYGGDGADWIISGENEDYVDGGCSDDYIFGDNGYDNINGNDGNDYIDGGEHNDAVYGSNGNDTLIGAGGDDYIVGGADNDQIIGGAGADLFAYLSQSGFDRIDDFSFASGDRFYIPQSTNWSVYNGSGGAVVDFGSIGSALLINIDQSQIHSGWFGYA